MRYLLWLSVLVVGCGGNPTRTPVSSAEYGEGWPFTLAQGTLECVTDGPRQIITLDAGNGIAYGLNGTAREAGFPDHRGILKPEKTSADVQPLITKGLTLCPK